MVQRTTRYPFSLPTSYVTRLVCVYVRSAKRSTIDGCESDGSTLLEDDEEEGEEEEEEDGVGNWGPK
jgi:hypothetical protein